MPALWEPAVDGAGRRVYGKTYVLGHQALRLSILYWEDFAVGSVAAPTMVLGNITATGFQTANIGGLAGDLGGEVVQLVGAVGEMEVGEGDGMAAKGVGLDHVGAGGEVGAVDVEDDVGAHPEDVFAAVLVLGPAEVVDGDALVQHAAHGSVEDEDTFGEGADPEPPGRDEDNPYPDDL